MDTQVFKPGDKQAARSEWNLPHDHLIVLSAAAIKSTHKRMDYLIREFAEWSDRCPTPALLVVAGAREAETDGIIQMGRDLLGNRVLFLENVSREKMPSLYQASDIFALASLARNVRNRFLEALACALPIVCNDTPTLRWVSGPAAKPNDLTEAGGVVHQLDYLSQPVHRATLANQARAHAEAVFSETVVTDQYLALYESVARGKKKQQKERDLLPPPTLGLHDPR